MISPNHEQSIKHIRAICLICVLLMPAIASGAQVLDSTRAMSAGVKAKDPDLAANLGFFPGVGHVYAGETTEGIILGVGTVAGFAIAISEARKENGDCRQPNTCSADGGPTDGYWVGVVMILGCWGTSIMTARKAAVRYNERHGVSISLAPGVNGTTRLGLAMRF